MLPQATPRSSRSASASGKGKEAAAIFPSSLCWNGTAQGRTTPKGQLEDGETPAEAAIRETREEVVLTDLRLEGPIRIIDWRFRAKGRKLIHKFCHFFLLESPVDEPAPQLEEGITACRWCTLEEAVAELSYENARSVLRRAGEMARTLTAVGHGRPRELPKPIGDHPPHYPSWAMPAVAALLDTPAALQSLRRTLVPGPPAVVACRSPGGLERAYRSHLVDAVVLGTRALRDGDLASLHAGT